MQMGEKILKLRLEKGLTLEQLGDLVGVGKSTVRKWENGMIANMRRDKIAKIAEALNVSPGYLMGWEEKHEGTAASCSPDSSGSVPEGALIVSDPNEVEVIEAYRKKDLSGRNMIRGALGLPMLGESSTSGSAGPADLRGEENIA